VDLAVCFGELHTRGWTALLTEGGPTLFSRLLGAGLVDELDLSLAPRIVVGEAIRITHGAALDGRFLPRVLVEQDGTVMGRWVREQSLRS
jgi:riboflavin biosynthesis pyrimidine reductase